MSTVPRRLPRSREDLPPLENGERLTQREFHRRYEAYPEDVKFELIGGTVYMASPLRQPHATYHAKLSLVLGLYEAATPGVELLDNATTILGEESEPQPDLELRILTEYGGQTRINKKKYVVGAPELLVEVASSTTTIDMHQKKDDYEQAGVLEYLVLCIREKELHWFGFGSHRPIRPNRQGIYRSQVFPGLWIDGPALLARNARRLIEVIQQGVESKEHTTFVQRLEAAYQRRSSKS
ncbi:MAG TPA: Uma2 family endonuclease [Gemmataceae bacterium]|nr:Uma2 family endonuclease [Gemmataceae bacterium]